MSSFAKPALGLFAGVLAAAAGGCEPLGTGPPPVDVVRAIELLAPPDNASLPAGSIVTFAWREDAAAERYNIQIAVDSGFVELQFADSVAEATTTLGSLAPGPYYWRIRGEHPANGWGPWGETRALGVGVFSVAFGGLEEEVGFSLAGAPWGGYAVAGYTQSFGPGGSDIFVLRTDSLGNLLWSGSYGGVSFDWAESILAAPEGGYTIAGTSKLGLLPHEMVVLKVSSTGEQEWITTFGIRDDELFGLSILSWDLGGYLVAGHGGYYGQAATVHVVNFDGDGNRGWRSALSVSRPAGVRMMRKTSDGGFVLAGQSASRPDTLAASLIKIDLFGEVEWERSYAVGLESSDGHDVRQSLDGGYILAGSFGSPNGGFLIKTDAEGHQEWSRKFIGEVSGISAIALTSDGGYILGASTNQGEGTGGVPCLIRTDELGTEIWRRKAGSDHYKGEIAALERGADGFIAAGTTWPGVNVPGDFWLLKTNREGYLPAKVTTVRLMGEPAKQH